MRFKLIMVFVDEAKTDQVLESCRKAGATGATIINNVQGQGLKRYIGIFGLELLNPRNVLLILVEDRRADEVLQAALQAGGLDESLNTGIALMLDVEKAVGLSEHIKTLAEQHPV